MVIKREGAFEAFGIAQRYPDVLTGQNVPLDVFEDPVCVVKSTGILV